MDHPEKLLDQEVTLTMPIKFVTAILRATQEAAIFQAIKLAEDDCDENETPIRLAILNCYEEVHKILTEVHDQILKPEDMVRIQKFARALNENEGVRN